jgi:hypothetical protein
MGNCLDKTLSDDSADENIIEDDLNNNNINSENLNNPTQLAQSTTVQQSRTNSNISSSSNSSNGSSHRRHRHHRSHRHGNGSRSSRYIQIIESSLPVRSTSSSHNNNNRQYSQSYVNSGYSSTSFSSSPLNLSNSLGSSSSQQVYYLTPNVQRTADQLTEEDQIKLLKRMALVQQLPSGSYDENKKNKEYVFFSI